MTRSSLLALLSTVVWTAGACQAQEGASRFPVLEGPYLGQDPPGDVPETFVPGVISSDLNEHGAPSFSPDLTEVYWSPQYRDIKGGRILLMKIVGDRWSSPHGRLVFRRFSKPESIVFIGRKEAILQILPTHKCRCNWKRRNLVYREGEGRLVITNTARPCS